MKTLEDKLQEKKENKVEKNNGVKKVIRLGQDRALKTLTNITNATTANK